MDSIATTITPRQELSSLDFKARIRVRPGMQTSCNSADPQQPGPDTCEDDFPQPGTGPPRSKSVFPPQPHAGDTWIAEMTALTIVLSEP